MTTERSPHTAYRVEPDPTSNSRNASDVSCGQVMVVCGGPLGVVVHPETPTTTVASATRTP